MKGKPFVSGSLGKTSDFRFLYCRRGLYGIMLPIFPVCVTLLCYFLYSLLCEIVLHAILDIKCPTKQILLDKVATLAGFFQKARRQLCSKKHTLPASFSRL